MRPHGTMGAFMTVREASWTGADDDGPTPGNGYAAIEPYIDVLRSNGSVSYRLPEPQFGEVGEQVELRFYSRGRNDVDLRAFEGGADSTLYQVRARCSKTVDGVKTVSAVVRRCFALNTTAACPSA